MLIAHPNRDGSSTGTLFYPLEGAESFAALRSRRDIRRFFEKQFPDAAALIPDLEAQFFGAPTGALSEIACDPWHFQDRALLLGDSAHGIPPFLGQGLNSAFESVALLMDCFHRFAGDWEEAFRTFQRIRKPDTDAAAKLAQDNFVEMRDRIADPRFLFRKQVELELERRFFPRFISRFGMIQFSRTSYARARDFGDVNDGILDELTADAACLDDIRWREAKRMIEERL